MWTGELTPELTQPIDYIDMMTSINQTSYFAYLLAFLLNNEVDYSLN